MNAKTKVPRFTSEAQERKFWEAHDSAELIDWSKAKRVRLPNLKPSTQSISLRLPVHTLERIKAAANARDVPYQSLIKVWLEEKLSALREYDQAMRAYLAKSPVKLKRAGTSYPKREDLHDRSRLR
jgi:predicted DNA binding CopG/RHH family protein